jgi:adenylate cyclase
MAEAQPRNLTFFQRYAMRRLVKAARKRPGEPLSETDWAAYFAFGLQESNQRMKWMLRGLPSSPRCGFCGAPFQGVGGRLVRPLGYRPSRKNPNLCDVCVELAPPGGMTTNAGVLFADLRGFTAMTDRSTPREVSVLLRRFYAVAENVLLPQALIDKLIGDEVMALYLSFLAPRDHDGDEDQQRRAVAATMLDHARELLAAIGYGTPSGPFAEVGIGLDFGEAFVGNIGDGSVRDFTAVGDVVNTASRLQAHAAGGEIVLSSRIAALLVDPPGDPVELTVKGKDRAVAARRVQLPDTSQRRDRSHPENAAPDQPVPESSGAAGSARPP